jgi:hypothetical protein
MMPHRMCTGTAIPVHAMRAPRWAEVQLSLCTPWAHHGEQRYSWPHACHEGTTASRRTAGPVHAMMAPRWHHGEQRYNCPCACHDDTMVSRGTAVPVHAMMAPGCAAVQLQFLTLLPPSKLMVAKFPAQTVLHCLQENKTLWKEAKGSIKFKERDFRGVPQISSSNYSGKYVVRLCSESTMFAFVTSCSYPTMAGQG